MSSFLGPSPPPHPPSTSPVSPFVLHHNGGRLIILKTADYQSGRFQGPTSKQRQQYGTEREFLPAVRAPADQERAQTHPACLPACRLFLSNRSTPSATAACGDGGGRVGCIPGKVGLFLGKRSGAHVGEIRHGEVASTCAYLKRRGSFESKQCVNVWSCCSLASVFSTLSEEHHSSEDESRASECSRIRNKSSNQKKINKGTEPVN